MHYYEVHVQYGNCGYSIFIESEKELKDKQSIIDYAVEQKEFYNEGDEKYVDYTKSISEDTYNWH